MQSVTLAGPFPPTSILNPGATLGRARPVWPAPYASAEILGNSSPGGSSASLPRMPRSPDERLSRQFQQQRCREYPAEQPHRPERRHAVRSEEHTSELQSLMRISYAVFCLKKKNTK